jgi:hypothetical protein
MAKVRSTTVTITTPKRHRRSNSVEWTVIQAGLWVGKKNNEFAGMIEARWGEGFSATTRLGKNLGMFATVEQAQASFEE